jgi:hypothetical protein
MDSSVPLSDSSRLTVPKHVVARQASGETVLLNLDNEHYYGLEGVGTRLWELVEAGTTFRAAVTVLLNEYDVDRDALEADLTALIAELHDNGLVAVDGA